MIQPTLIGKKRKSSSSSSSGIVFAREEVPEGGIEALSKGFKKMSPRDMSGLSYEEIKKDNQSLLVRKENHHPSSSGIVLAQEEVPEEGIEALSKRFQKMSPRDMSGGVQTDLNRTAYQVNYHYSEYFESL